MKRSILSLLAAAAVTVFAHRAEAQGKRDVVNTPRGSVTFVHEATGSRVLRIEDAESIGEPQYDARGVETGIAVTPTGTTLRLSVAHEPGDRLVVDGMPRFHRIATSEGRTGFIRGDSAASAIVSFRFASSGRAQSVTIGDGLTLEFGSASGESVNETLKDSKGRTLGTTTATSGEGRIASPLALDLVATELGLGDDWTKTVRLSTGASNLLTTVSTADGRPILYVVNEGRDRVGFDVKGRPLFVDMAIDLTRKTQDVSGGDVIDDAAAMALSGVVPDHVVVSQSGGIQLYVSRASRGAINTVTTTRDLSGRTVTRFRVAGSETASGSAALVGPLKHRPTSESASLHVKTSTICADPYYETVCTSGDYIDTSCTTSSGWSYYDCGGGGGDGSGGTSGGGGASSGNNIQGDAQMRLMVEQAMQQATTKLASPQCAALLDTNNTTGQNTTLRVFMNSRGYTDPGSYFNSFISFINGTLNSTGTDPCATGSAAWTTYYSSTVNVCAVFKNYGTGMQADLLIHEMLHTLGLPESPTTAGALTSSQITQMVVNACGP